MQHFNYDYDAVVLHNIRFEIECNINLNREEMFCIRKLLLI